MRGAEARRDVDEVDEDKSSPPSCLVMRAREVEAVADAVGATILVYVYSREEGEKMM